MVLRHSRRSLLAILLLCLIAGCSGTPVAPKSSQANTAAPKAPIPKTGAFMAAQRFMNSWGAGEMIQSMMQREIEKRAAEQPGMSELMKRVLADSSADEFADLAAGVYARHIDQADLEVLATFTETPAGNRFFKTIVGAVLAGEELDQNAIMRQFNADEITELMKFFQNPAFATMQAKLPTINKEMSEEGRKYGERKLKEYLKRK